MASRQHIIFSLSDFSARSGRALAIVVQLERLGGEGMSEVLGKEGRRDGGERLQWTFAGRVLPERVPLSISVPGTGFQLHSIDEIFHMDIHLWMSQIVVKLDGPAGFLDHFTLRNAVEGSVREVVDLIGYQMGIAFDVEIISNTNSIGNWSVYGIDIPVVAEARTSIPGALLSDHLNAVMGDVGARIALSDFREAMKTPVQTGFFCYRAVEAMMQTFSEGRSSKQEERAWIALRDSLNVSKSAIDVIKSHADWARHGREGSITGDERATIFRLTDEILRRYLTYIYAGRKSLAAEDFAMMDETFTPPPRAAE